MFTWKVSQQIHTIITKVNTPGSASSALKGHSSCTRVGCKHGGHLTRGPRGAGVSQFRQQHAHQWRARDHLLGFQVPSAPLYIKQQIVVPLACWGPPPAPSSILKHVGFSSRGTQFHVLFTCDTCLNTNIIILNLGKIKGTSEAALYLSYSIIPLDQGWENWFLSGR